MQIIIFPQENGHVSVITPAPEFANQIEAIAQKDVPYQQEWISTEVTEENPSGGHWINGEQIYRIIDSSELPDYSLRALWRWTPEGSLDIANAPLASVPASISFAQLLIGIVTEQWITEVEGEAWLSGVLPFAVLTVIDNLPAEQRFAAKARALRPSEIARNDSLVNAMAIAAGKSDDDIDNFFRTYSGV
jgi:hypothetical protein